MTNCQRSTMLLALIIASVLVTLNIFAVTSGVADSYYESLQIWVAKTLH